jgi:hypothetical protein
VLTCGVTTSLSMMSVVLSGWTPEPGSGSVRVAEMTGQAVVMTEPPAGTVSLMRGGWSSNCRLKRVPLRPVVDVVRRLGAQASLLCRQERTQKGVGSPCRVCPKFQGTLPHAVSFGQNRLAKVPLALKNSLWEGEVQRLTCFFGQIRPCTCACTAHLSKL